MIMTINLTAPVDPIDPTIIHGTNTIVNIKTNSSSSIRNMRYINAWDVTTDILPIMNNIPGKIKIVQTGYYDTNGIKIPSVLSGVTRNSIPIQINDEFNVNNDLGFNLATGSSTTGIRILTDNTLEDYIWYVDYVCDYGNGFETKWYELKIYAGLKIPITSITYQKTVILYRETVTPLILQNINNFDFVKLENPGVPIVLTDYLPPDMLNIINQIYPTSDAYFIPKMVFTKNDYQSSYTGYEEVKGFSYFGKPVYYGQSMNVEQINNGQLIFNSIGSSAYKQELALEGFISGLLYKEQS